MMPHIDPSKPPWFSDQWHNLIVVLDDATGEIYYAQLVDEESTLTVMAALRAVVEKQSWFWPRASQCALHVQHNEA
jgi:sensor domain CHASE-containing protein